MITSKAVGAGWNLDNSYACLPEIFYSKLDPTSVSSPQLVILNHRLAEFLGLNADALQTDEEIAVLAGNRVPKGASPLAQAYGGHQFGYFTRLGDGRALLLGEQKTPQGQIFDIQLKGSGRTPYSRGGDGRAPFGPMLREYIISEGMAALGIPTTRSLAVVKTGESVIRETRLPGAILTRVATSHIRVGTFQYAAKWGSIEDLRSLADYTLRRHYPDINFDGNQYYRLLLEVIDRQASLIAKWQLVGFVHGVMNTDNMTISGETIDYGPCAFMDSYDPATVFSSIDTYGRYAYGNQPQIGAWNLARFAEALLPLLHENHDEAVKLANTAIADYQKLYKSNWQQGMRSKLGIFNEEPEDEVLFEDLLSLMQQQGADYTNTFRALTIDALEDSSMFSTSEYSAWHRRWLERLGRQQNNKDHSLELMRSTNPAIIPRNHRVEEALEAAVKREDYCVMERLLNVLMNPYAYSPDQDEYAMPSNHPYRTFCGV